ncbi:MAG: MBL fold metallo-hydrolase [Anaerolineales bacterium]|nr:MBL fold metallo-hydrolase [Anaerolineales bacterium]
MLKFQLITDNIARLEAPTKIAELLPSSVAVWLVKGDKGFVLIDSGPPEFAGEIVDAISKATNGRGPSIVLLTHAHYNHAGSLTAIRMAWNPPIAAHRAEIPFVKGDYEYSRIRSTSPMFWLGSLLMVATPWSIPNVQEIDQGQKIMGLTVLNLPGHTPGHLGFVHAKDRACICGDAAMNVGGRISGPFALTTPDKESAKQSLSRMTERNFKHLLPSHGTPILEQGRTRLFRYVRKGQKRKRPRK